MILFTQRLYIFNLCQLCKSWILEKTTVHMTHSQWTWGFNGQNINQSCSTRNTTMLILDIPHSTLDKNTYNKTWFFPEQNRNSVHENFRQPLNIKKLKIYFVIYFKITLCDFLHANSSIMILKSISLTEPQI